MGVKHSPTRSASKIAMIYAAISVIWIIGSDQLLAATVSTIETMTLLQMIKGWAFVLATSLLIFGLMQHEIKLFFQADEDRRSSESSFKLLVDSAPDAIFLHTRGQFAYLNTAATALFGATDASQLIKSPVMDRVHPDYHDIVRERLCQLNLEMQPVPPIELAYLRMNGSSVQVEAKSIPFIFQGEDGALSFVRDITERKLAEEMLKRFELLVENSRDIIFFIHREDGRILEANAAAISAYGYPREELLGHCIRDLREASTLENFSVQMAKADNEGILFETVHRRKDGSCFPVEVSSRGATILGVRTLITIVRDISERKQSEESLKSSEKRFRELANSMPDLVWTATAEGRIVYFNRRIEEFKGFEKQPDGEWDWSGMVHPDDLDATMAALAHAISSSRVHEFEHRLLLRDGTYKWFLSRGTPVYGSDGRVTKWYGTSTDIDRQKMAEAELAKSNARLRLALDSAQMGVWEQDLKTNHVTGDKNISELFGAPNFRGEMRDFYELIDPGHRASTKDLVRKAIESREQYTVEFQITRLDGAKRWLKSQGRVICDHQDQPSRILGVIWDITDGKQAQLREQEATRRLDMLVTESPAVVFTYELEPELHLNFISRNVETILGWKPEEFTTNMGLWAQCIHPEDVPSIDAGKCLLAETGKHVFEYRFKDSQGKYRWIHDEQRIINGEGRPKAVVGAWWDITETKAALAELTLLKAAIEQAAEIVLITDAKADIVYVNPAFEKVTGYRPQEALGKNPRILKSGEQDNSFYQTLWGQLIAGKTWRGRFVNKRKDGHFYTEEASISPVRDPSGNVVNYVAVKRDVSRELELEKQFLDAQKMEAIGTLAGGVAHDFNNILAIILANAEILDFSEEFGSESRFTLNQIITASKRARELVRQILAFSRRGRQDKILMNLRPIVRETMGLLRSSLPSFIRIETYIGDDTGMIFADPTQMQQVIMNLCTNAGHAMEQKGGLLRIALANTTIADESPLLEPDFPPGDYVQLTVSDTGHGMPPWLLKKIFEPYFTTKEPGKGTGLGLPVAFGIVKSHGGTIKVSSGAGSGSIFEVYLPRARDEALAPEKSEMPLATGTGKVLFVDDEPALTLVVQKMIGRLGYEVQTAHSPIEALELFRSDPKAFDLVITDMTMPEMTGTNLAKVLLDIRPDLPVVLCTGYSDQVNEEMLETLRIKALLIKPITIQELAHAIRMALIR